MPWRTQPRVTPSAYARRLRHQRLGSLNRGLGLHLKRLLNTGWPGAEAVFDLLIPDSFDVALRFERGSGTGPILLSQATFLLAPIANSGPVPLSGFPLSGFVPHLFSVTCLVIQSWNDPFRGVGQKTPGTGDAMENSTQSDPFRIREKTAPSKTGITQQGSRASSQKTFEHWVAWCRGRF